MAEAEIAPPTLLSNNKESKSVCKEYISKFYFLEDAPAEQTSGQRSTTKSFISKAPEPDVDVLGHYETERVRFMMEHPIIKKQLESWITQSTSASNSTNNFKKNHSQALSTRQIGNKYFQVKKLHQALDAYNESLRLTPFNNPSQLSEIQDVGIILANRSAVLFELGKYSEALPNIQLAIEQFSYPSHLLPKILIRQINILIKLKRFSEGRSLIEKCRQDYIKDRDFLSKIEEVYVKLEAEEDKSCAEKDEEDPIVVLNNFTPNPNYVNASATVDIKYLQEAGGRCIITNQHLSLGDVIYYEPPYASVLLPDYYNSHCYQCHVQLNQYSLYSCRNCTQILYCSASCSNESWTETHQYECLHLDLLSSTGIGHLALRVGLIAGVAMVIDTLTTKLHRSADDDDSTVVTTKDIRKDLSLFCIDNQNSYLRVYSLLDHLTDMKPEDAFQYTLTASLLAQYLYTKTCFFGNKTSETDLDQIYMFGGAILHHICQLICNAHALSSIESEVPDSPDPDDSESKVNEFNQVRIATGLYPSASLLNHSCSPNILSVFKNGRILVTKVASDSISSGSQIFNCYGPHYRRMPVTERQQHLAEQYFFTCSCVECTKELRSKISFADKFLAFKCSECDGAVIPDFENNCFDSICTNCGKCQYLEKSMKLALMTDKLFSEGMELLNQNGLVKQALKTLIKCYKLRKTILYKYHSDLGNFSDCVAKCYVLLGDYNSALKFSHQSLKYVQERFGPNSIEWAREFKKFIQIKSKVKDDDQVQMSFQGLDVQDTEADDGFLEELDETELQKLNEMADQILTLAT